ncbi:MAG: hypothetical protein DME25_03570, partial [Verrucomicrobia bacterium]
MKTYLPSSLLLAVFLSFTPWHARANNLAGSGDPFTITFDENGNSLIDLRDGSPLVPAPWGMLADPTQPGNPPVLTYFLPGPIVNGDVRIWEDASFSILSDVLRFTDAQGNLTGQTADRMIYYSERPEPGEVPPFELADTGFPPFLLPIDGGGVAETGPEGGPNGFTWAPGGPWDNIYNGISDVPEPGPLSWLALGGAGWFIACRRKKGRRERPGQRAGPVALCLLAFPATRLVAQPVVDVIPNAFSGETVQNSEPSIAVNPNGPANMFISSFGRLPGQPLNTQPYFKTANGGTLWSNFDNINHGDATLDWSPGVGGKAYTVTINRLPGNLRQDVVRREAADFQTVLANSAYPTPPTTDPADQPFLIVGNAGGPDRFYIGINDLNQPANNPSRTAIVRLFTDTDPVPSWRNVILDPGAPLAVGTRF